MATDIVFSLAHQVTPVNTNQTMSSVRIYLYYLFIFLKIL